MALLKNLKSLFIVEEDNPKAEKENNTKESPKKEEVKAEKKESKPSTFQPTIKPVKGEVNSKFTETLLKAIEANNLEGFDYLEFKQALQNMTKSGLDEATSFKTAFITAQTMGVTPQKLTDSATFYLNILKAEQDKFQQALEMQKDKNVTQRQTRLTDLDKAVKAKNAQLKKLQEEIESHAAEMEKIKGEVNTVAHKITVTKSNFDASYIALKQQLEADINKIGQYLS